MRFRLIVSSLTFSVRRGSISLFVDHANVHCCYQGVWVLRPLGGLADLGAAPRHHDAGAPLARSLRIGQVKTSLPKKLFVGLGLAGVIVAAVCLMTKSSKPSVQMADGSTLTLERVAYLRRNALVQRLPWIGAFRAWFERQFSRMSFSRPLPPDTLVVWLSCRQKGTGKFLDFDWLARAVSVDSHGCRFETMLPMVHSQNWSAPGWPLPTAPAGAVYVLASVVLPAFPRREKVFRLQLYGQQFTQAVELGIPNPVYRSYPQWKPEALPATHRSGDLTVSLVSFSNQMVSPRYNPFRLKVLRPTPQFQFGTEEPPAAGWKLDDLKVEDATGNRQPIQSWFGPPSQPWASPSQARPWIGSPRKIYRNYVPLSDEFQLCTRESAWRLRASFSRTPQAPIASNEVWTVPHLLVPPPGTTQILNISNICQGVTIRLCAVGGPGNLTYSNGIPVRVAASNRFPAPETVGGSSPRVAGRSFSMLMVDTAKVQLTLHLSGFTEGFNFHAFAQHEDARYDCSARETSGGHQVLLLDLPKETPWVDVNFVVQRRHSIDFLVRPPLPTEP
jgi:hypothetical protein